MLSLWNGKLSSENISYEKKSPSDVRVLVKFVGEWLMKGGVRIAVQINCLSVCKDWWEIEPVSTLVSVGRFSCHGSHCKLTADITFNHFCLPPLSPNIQHIRIFTPLSRLKYFVNGIDSTG